MVCKIKISTGFQNRSKEVILTSQIDNAKNSVSYFYLSIMVQISPIQFTSLSKKKLYDSKGIPPTLNTKTVSLNTRSEGKYVRK